MTPDTPIKAGLWLLAAILICFAVHQTLKRHPTPDELYGCTVAQQAPNGECK
jgi:hypothetical protein